MHDSLGPQVVAGHQIALNFASLLFMVPLSLSLAATVRVGLARGREDQAGLRLAISSALMMTFAVGATSALLLSLLHPWIPLIYSSNPAVAHLAGQLLLFGALYQISDAWQVTASGALRGYEDTDVPMLITLLAYWGIGLPTGYVLGLTDVILPAMGPYGFWIGLLTGLTAAAVLLSIRLWHRVHQKHTVERNVS